MRPKRRKRAPIGTDHYDVAPTFIDAWLEELEIATFRRLQREHPEMTSDQLTARSLVLEYDDGRGIWVSIGTTLAYLIEKKTGKIFQVGDQHINRKECYGYVRWWHGYDWSTVPRRRI
jgi:hypothetical protein